MAPIIFSFIPQLKMKTSPRIAYVVIMTASTLVNSTFGELMDYTGNARLVGLYSLGGSLIPDDFF
jgi:uncharacterized protein (DUF4213/DUF364 family)